MNVISRGKPDLTPNLFNGFSKAVAYKKSLAKGQRYGGPSLKHYTVEAGISLSLLYVVRIFVGNLKEASIESIFIVSATWHSTHICSTYACST
jgi:hypothetical protein